MSANSAVSELRQELMENPRKWYLFNYATSISHINRYVYIETPKVACTTIKATLMSLELSDLGVELIRPSSGGLEFLVFPYGKENASDHVGIHHPPIASPFINPYQLRADGFLDVFESGNYFVFAFVRNPFSRVLSAYLDKMSRDSTERRAINKLLGRPAEVEPSFQEFVTAVSMQSTDDMDPHWRPQTACLRTDRIAYSFIGKFETLQSDLEKVDDALGGVLTRHINKVCPHETRASSKVGEYYSMKIADVVRLIYRDDFEVFGYSDRITC